MNRPAIAMQKANFRNFVGEDIELANRALAQATSSTSARAEVSFYLRTFFIITCCFAKQPESKAHLG